MKRYKRMTKRELEVAHDRLYIMYFRAKKKRIKAKLVKKAVVVLDELYLETIGHESIRQVQA